ncbi:MAG: bifunctional folylpolyglutamate synthase/dihydrofolate synthase [Lachnospiraceae bacterium]|nr:bifunctional folylpolyglutamate synthase/dihydrofolate synthase [Lachnospiraceae bacterium]
MTAAELEEYISVLKARGFKPGLSSVTGLCEKLGNPQDHIRAVHITGTNAKGSVLAYLTSVLRAAGVRCGCFYSPAMEDDRETVRAGGRCISKNDWQVYWERIAKAEDELKKEGKDLPTFFEALTALAFMYFKDKDCDIAVVECGMGGKGDATNILKHPLVCVFTPISGDHMQFLGSDTAAIAGEKSGIIKQGASVVSSVQDAGVTEVILKAAKEAGCPFETAGSPEKIRYGLNSQSFELKGYGRLKIGLSGAYQPANAALAVKVIEQLVKKGIKISDKALRAGLENAQWYGRFSVLGRKPCIIADGAHNEAGAEALKNSLDIYFPDSTYVLMMGVLRDKEYRKILKILSGRACALVTLTPPSNARALDSMELAEAGSEYINNTTAAGSVEEAYEMALLLSGGEKPLVACGSLSWLNKFKNVVEERKGKR